MTNKELEEKIIEILEIHRKSVDWKKEAPTFNAYRANKIISLLSTEKVDVEEIKKEFTTICKTYMGTTVDYNMGMVDDLLQTVLPHIKTSAERMGK